MADGADSAAPRPYVIGVTGNIASGKSTVMSRLAEEGVAAIDADTVYHELIEPGRPLNRALRETFGEAIVQSDGTIDRSVLGRIVFADPAALATLDALTHPAIEQALRDRIANESGPIVAIDAVKLIEAGFDRDCDEVWAVVANRGQQVERLVRRNAISVDEATRRVDAQPPLARKLERADVVIDNRGDMSETLRQVDAALRAAERRAASSIERRGASSSSGRQAT
jgi:dephospho-CoA kinase